MALTTVTPAQVVYEPQDNAQLIQDLKNISLQSKATPAEFLSLRDDVRAISQVAKSSVASAKTSTAMVNAATLILDRAMIDGSFGASAWSLIEGRLGNDLAPLGVPQTLINQTISDMQAVAASASVSSPELNSITNDISIMTALEQQPGGSSYGYPDPQIYFSQNLLGFFRGLIVQRATDRAKLNADVHDLTTAAGATPAGVATVQRDAQDLQALAAPLTSAEGQKWEPPSSRRSRKGLRPPTQSGR